MMIEVSLFLVALAALGTMIAAIFNSWQIREIHDMVNGRLTQLLDLTKSASRAEGVKEGREGREGRET